MFLIEECIPETKIPRPELNLFSSDGNAFALMGRAQKTLKKAGAPSHVIENFLADAMGGDYNHLLSVMHDYLDIEWSD